MREKREDNESFCVEWVVQAEGMACNLFDFSYAPDKHSAFHFTVFFFFSYFIPTLLRIVVNEHNYEHEYQMPKKKTFTETNFNWHFSFQMMGLVFFSVLFRVLCMNSFYLLLFLSLMHLNHISLDHLFISFLFDTCVCAAVHCCAVKMSSIYGRSTFANACIFHLSIVCLWGFYFCRCQCHLCS